MARETIVWEPEGTCSDLIRFELEDGRIAAVSFEGGCSGNLEALSRLLVGMEVAEAVARLRGIRCGDKPTSCPDQLARAFQSRLLEG